MRWLSSGTEHATTYLAQIECESRGATVVSDTTQVDTPDFEFCWDWSQFTWQNQWEHAVWNPGQ